MSLLRAAITSVAKASNSPVVAMVVSLSSRVTADVAFLRLPALVEATVTVNVSALSTLLSAKIGRAIVAEVRPARMVTVCEDCAVKSVPAVAVSDEEAATLYVIVISSVCARLRCTVVVGVGSSSK